MKADKLFRSNAIFTGISDLPFAGFIATKENKIIAVGYGDGHEYIEKDTEIFNLEDRLVCPGFVDVHCFFTGYLITKAGQDLSHCTSADEVVYTMLKVQKNPDGGKTLLGRGVKPELVTISQNLLDEKFGQTPIILFHEGNECCYMNSAAITEYQFTPDKCYPESYWRLLKYILNDIPFSVSEFKDYMHFMNSKGITAIKEMAFDDYYGFTDRLKELEQSNGLTTRVHFMSQPVGYPMNISFGKKMREYFKGDFVRFSGYNQMTDGSISQVEGDMKEPYLCEDTCCRKQIDWKTIEKDVLSADKEGFRFSLHAQGDAAIAKVINIFDKCEKNVDGKVKLRHAITDLECSDPKDLETMGSLGIVAEVYPQIMSIANRKDKVAMINEKIGMERGKNYWNRRKMADCGVIISCGTDLPLLFDDIPESIYHSVGGLFPEGGEPFNPENTLTISELLKAWSYGGQYNLGMDHVLGTLETGKLADIVVFDRNLFQTPMEEIRNSKVCLTLVNGDIVYQNL